MDACAGDEGMRSEIEAMLAQPGSSDGFLGGLPLAATSTPDGMGTPDLTNRSFGPYHIEARIGAGGMGEVHRARDTKLGRAVAIKFLPHVFTNDPERLARFEREGACWRRSITPTSAQSTGSKKPTACAAWCSSSCRAKRWRLAFSAARYLSLRR